MKKRTRRRGVAIVHVLVCWLGQDMYRYEQLVEHPKPLCVSGRVSRRIVHLQIPTGIEEMRNGAHLTVSQCLLRAGCVGHVCFR